MIAWAQVNTNYNIALGTTSPLDVAVSIINWGLGILALIAVCIILYGGFIWLTSGGNEEKIDKAKRILRNGIIGLIIILASWGIATYLLNKISEWTGLGEGGYATPYYPGYDMATSPFYIDHSNPADGEINVPLCHIVAVTFSLPVVQETINATNFVVTTNNEVVSGTFDFSENGQAVVFYPAEDFLQNTAYQVEISPDIQGTDESTGRVYNLLTTDPKRVFSFTTGTETDEIPPTVDIVGLQPFPRDEDTDACLNTPLRATFSESLDPASPKDSNVWLWNYDASATPADSLDVKNINIQSLGGEADDTILTYPETALEKYTNYGVSLYSGDPNNDFAGAIKDTCGNALDGDYDMTEEGSSTDDFVHPLDSDSSDGWDYPWTFTTGETADCIPVIESISQENTPGYYSEDLDPTGETGSTDSDKVTVVGKYLIGFTDLTFYYNISAAGMMCFNTDHEAEMSCYISEGVSSTGSDTITVRAPVGSRTGKIEVENVAGSDTSDDDYINGSPYISWLSPPKGPAGQFVTIKGENFVDDAVGIVYFDDMIAEFPCEDSWDDTEIIVKVPGNFAVDDTPLVQVVTAADKYSNQALFTITDGQPGPGLCDLEPDCSNTGSDNVTATGENFGSRGRVYFDTTEGTVASWEETTMTTAGTPVTEQKTYDFTLGNTNGISNGLDFQIPCAPAPEVFEYSGCSDNTYYLPNPPDENTNACVNSVITIAFTQDVSGAEEATKIYQCTDKDTECTTEITGTWSSGYLPDYFTGGTEAEGRDTSYEYFKFTPATNLTANTWYKVYISKEVQNEYGVKMADDYSFNFKVRDDSNPCKVEKLYLTPSYEIVNYHPETVDFNANPSTADCLQIQIQGDWDWTVDNGQIVAFNDSGLTSETISGAGERNTVQTQGDGKDNQGEAIVTTEVEGVSDTSRVKVDFGYCESDEWCNTVEGCESSTCDLASSRCTPVISSFSPSGSDATGPNGCVTINGCYFGAERIAEGASSGGSVKFGEREADYDINPSCETWTNDQVIAQVTTNTPADFYSINLTSEYELSTSTGDDKVNIESTQHPCLCKVEPDAGREGYSNVTLYGDAFGTSGGGVEFAGATEWKNTTYGNWANQQIDSVVVPDYAITAEEGVRVEDSSGYTSNALPFTVTCYTDDDCATGCCSGGECSPASVCNACVNKTDCTDVYEGCYGDCVNGQCTPYISSLNPSAGDTGQPVTIEGCYFGDSGTVTYDGLTAGLLCANGWSNTQIIVETPPSDNWATEAAVTVTNSTGTSNEASFTQDTQCTGYDIPVLCEVANQDDDANYGPYGEAVNLSGDHFADVDEQYCLCTNPNDGSESCHVDVDGSSCEYTGTCTIEEGCTVNRETYNATENGCLCTNPNDSDETCYIAVGETECNYSATCSLDASCSADSETYFSVGGFAVFPENVEIADADYDYQSQELIQTSVPSGATSGDVYTGVEDDENQCLSNTAEYNIQCFSCDDCQSGENCDFTVSSDNSFGYCQGGDVSFDCSEYPASCCGNTGCAETKLYDEEGNVTGSAYSCVERPTVIEVVPADGATGVCPNAEISLTFSEAMQAEDGTLDNEITLSGTTIELEWKTDTTLVLTQQQALTGGTSYTITITDGLVSANTGLAISDNDITYNFSTRDGSCPPERVELEAVEEEFAENNYYFTEDQQEEDLVATVYYNGEDGVAETDDDQALTPIENIYYWDWEWEPTYTDYETLSEAECSVAGILEDQEDFDLNQNRQTITANNPPRQPASTNITASAVGGSGDKYGLWEDQSIDGSRTVTVYFCDGTIWTYSDTSNQHFRFAYCQTEDLPTLSRFPTVVGGGDFLRELLFTFDDPTNEDVIGLRVFANDLNDNSEIFADSVSPDLWFSLKAPNAEEASPSATTVDDYQAVEVGTSTYVAATNLSGTTLYPNIYLLSYNEDAASETQQIYNELLETWTFNIQSSLMGNCEEDKEKVVRDTKRVNDLGTMAYLLAEYYDENENYPALESGSYVQGMTTSKWPSWQANLGNALGQSLAEDPVNEFADNSCPGQYYDTEAGTCWDPVNKVYTCRGDSHVYQYMSDGTTYNLYANLEYTRANWDASVADPCSDPHQCACFNYQLNSEDYADYFSSE